MAITRVGHFITQNTTSGATSSNYAVETQLDANNVGVIVIGLDNKATANGNSNTVTSVTDSQGNTWERMAENTYSPGAAANDGACVSIWTSKITTTLTTSDTITVSFSASVASDAITGDEYTVTSGKKLALVPGSIQRSHTGGDAGPSMTISGLTNKEYLFVRGRAQEINSTLQGTETANYDLFEQVTAVGGTSGASIGVRGESRILTATGDTSDPTFNSADASDLYLALEEVDVAGAAAAVTRTLLGVGV